MSTAADIIEALGGTFAVARALNIAPTTVSSWKQSGSIPQWRMDGVMALAKSKGLEIPQPKAA